MGKFNYFNFTDGDVSLDVRVSVEDNTIWLSINEMATLFGYSRQTISRHVQSTYKQISEDGCSGCSKMNLSLLKSGKTVKVPIYSFNIIEAIGQKLNNDIYNRLKIFVLKKTQPPSKKEDIIIYNNGTMSLNVKVSPEEETVWLTQAQISTLFETSVSNVSMHIKNIINEGELEPNSVIKDFLNTAPDGKQYLVSIYNLDMILAIGYRIKGKRAIEFRKWSSKILSDYLLKGYVINENRSLVTAENFLRLQNEVFELKNKVDFMENDKCIKEKIVFNGELFDAYELICSIIDKAKENIKIIDPYFDYRCLDYLKKVPSNVDKVVYKSSQSELSVHEINRFIKQYGNLTVVNIDNFHDRFLIIDNKLCYSIGASLNCAGNKTFGIYKWETKEIIDAIINNLN